MHFIKGRGNNGVGISRIILLQSQSHSVRSLMRAVAETGIEVFALEPRSAPGSFVRSAVRAIWADRHCRRGRTSSKLSWCRDSGAFRDCPVPSSLEMCARLVRGDGRNDAVVYIRPLYAAIAEAVRGPLCVYDAHDAFRFYTTWDPQVTQRLEQRMLNRADLVLSVAEALSEDFRKLTRTPIVTCRMAVSREFIEQMAEPLPLPADLAAVPRPIVGCTGFVDSNYDWDLIAAFARMLPEVSFVFVGGILKEPPHMPQRWKSLWRYPMSVGLDPRSMKIFRHT